MRSKRGKYWLLAAVACVLAAWRLLVNPAAAPTAAAAGSDQHDQRGAGLAFFSATADATAAPAALIAAARSARQRALTEQLQLVDKTYCDYRHATRYPDASRPASEQSDQLYPNLPVTDSHAMRMPGGRSDPAVQVQTSQSRVFLVAGEAVAFSLRAIDADGKALALVIQRAVAQGMTYQGQRATSQVALAFADDGAGVDAVAGDGAFAGLLAPAQTGLASFAGTIRTEIGYTAGAKSGFVLFDVVYTPEVPALWSGLAREVIEASSLVYYLKAEVRQAGRYIVTGRVDDAAGKPVALVTFNDVLQSGPNDIKLTVFGKLLRDAQPAQPLSLRDVDGYLLKENSDPDRALMPRLEGTVVRAREHRLTNFSDAEWQSEQRSRHLTEFARDIALAKGALKAFDPALPVPASACL